MFCEHNSYELLDSSPCQIVASTVCVGSKLPPACHDPPARLPPQSLTTNPPAPSTRQRWSLQHLQVVEPPAPAGKPPALADAGISSTCGCCGLQHLQVPDLPTPAGVGLSSTCRRWSLKHLQVLEAPAPAGAGDSSTCRCLRLEHMRATESSTCRCWRLQHQHLQVLEARAPAGAHE